MTKMKFISVLAFLLFAGSTHSDAPTVTLAQPQQASQQKKVLSAAEQEAVNMSLIDAVYKGTLADVQKALDGGADVNTTGIFGMTALHWAVRMDHKAIVKLLLSKSDIDVNIKDESGVTVLCEAACQKNETVVRLLLDRPDTNVNSQCKAGITALHWAAMRKHEGIVTLLLKRHDIDATIRTNSTTRSFPNGATAAELSTNRVIRCMIDFAIAQRDFAIAERRVAIAEQKIGIAKQKFAIAQQEVATIKREIAIAQQATATVVRQQDEIAITQQTR